MAQSLARRGQPGNYNVTPATRSNGDASGLELDASGNLRVNVMVGGSGGGTSSVTYNLTPPTLTDTQTTTLQSDSHGNLLTSLATKLAGEDITNDVLKVEHRYSTIAYATAQTATTIKSAAGYLHAINILGGTLGNLTIWDNTTNSGTTIVPQVTPTGSVCFTLDAPFANGLTFTTATNMVIQFSYR